VADLGEDDLIATYFAPLAGPDGLGLRDDAARFAVSPGSEIVVTCDALVGGVHFFPDDPPDAIAAKALRVNLSDLAAKGAQPRGFMLALALNDATRDKSWLAAFARGLRADVEDYGVPLLGGDTVRTPGPLTLSVTAFGVVPAGRMVRRDGARPGDLLYVSGTIGDAALGLQIRLGAIPARPGTDHLLARYLRPLPRNALAPALLACASGGMDVSDGLVGDLSKMMRVSGASAEVDVGAVPLSPAAAALIAQAPARLEIALTGGDDYEILASVPPQRAPDFEAQARAAGVSVTRIGRVVTGASPPTFRDAEGRALEFARGSFSHF
jgi:thiamine-monophosphate kinase